MRVSRVIYLLADYLYSHRFADVDFRACVGNYFTFDTKKEAQKEMHREEKELGTHPKLVKITIEEIE